MKFNNVAIAVKHFGTFPLELLSEFTSCKRLSQGMSCRILELKGHLRLASLSYGSYTPSSTKKVSSQLTIRLVSNTCLRLTLY